MRFALITAVILGTTLPCSSRAADAMPPIVKLTTDAEALLDRWDGERGILIEADKKITAALKLNPKSSAALVQRGRLLIMASWQGDKFPPEAAKAIEDAFLEAAAADPKSARPYILLGHFHTLTKDLSKAHRALSRAEALGSKDPWLYLNWADYYKANNEPLKVLEMAERAVATGKANRKALASAYYEMVQVTAVVKRDRKRADQIYDDLIALNPGNAWTRGNYARQVIVGFGDFAAAEALALEALAIMQYPDAMQTLSMALYGQWAAAIDRQAPAAEIAKLLAKARQFDPDASMFPECATREPAMKSVMKHLAARGAADVVRHRC